MLKSLRKAICKANLELPALGLVIFTWGNVSGINREKGLVVIKPSGVAYDELTPENMVIVDMEGNVVEGNLSPSSDLKTHLRLYQAFPDIAGVVHTHSTHATAFAQAGQSLPAYGTTHADYFYGPVPCTKVLRDKDIRGDYELETGNIIVETFANLDPNAIPGVLVNNHGPFTWGKSPDDAVHNAAVLEECARMAWISRSLNPEMGPIKQKLLDKHYNRKHGPGATYGNKKPVAKKEPENPDEQITLEQI
ncbi:MAG: L-ribulose-5-phosphate 4-epimerase [Defluviitaleaceae bacterium]|nr:L-ribulose-5-phosphate 4-epimerase [Defluviitaleaceae bacterium]